MTSGTGIDIVYVPRIAKLISDRGNLFLERWFTPDEIAYCNGGARPSHEFAARLAAKEAVFKSLRSRSDAPVPWLSIEISNGEHGAPEVRLTGSIHESAAQQGIGTIQLSLAHCGDYATAIALAEYAR